MLVRGMHCAACWQGGEGVTASMITPATIEAIKARRVSVPEEAVVTSRDGKPLISPQRIMRMTSQEWRKGFEHTITLLNSQVDEARTRTDGTEIAAYILQHGLDVIAHGIALFNGAHHDPRAELRAAIEETLKIIWDSTARTIQAGVEEYAGKLHAEQSTLLDAEREQMTAGADAAAREATEARRALDAASAQLTREREQWGQELARLQAQLDSERSATVNRERTARNEIHQLRQDLAASRTVIASLNAECERLETQATAPTSVEVPMNQPSTALESASLCLFLRERLRLPTLNWNASGVRLLDRDVAPHLTAWRAAYPTPEAMRAQLRAVVRPILAQAAA